MGLILVDASIAAKFVLTEMDTALALELLNGEDRLAAPGIIKHEVAGAVLRRLRSGTMELEPARTACDDWHAILADGRVHLVPVEEVYTQAVELAFETRHALVDCFYLATAQRLHAPLVTADRTFHARAGKVYSRVELLARAA